MITLSNDILYMNNKKRILQKERRIIAIKARFRWAMMLPISTTMESPIYYPGYAAGLTGVGNISADPAFVNFARHYRLSRLACINAGTNGVSPRRRSRRTLTHRRRGSGHGGTNSSARSFLTQPLSQSVLLQSNVTSALSRLAMTRSFSMAARWDNVTDGPQLSSDNALLTISNLNLSDGAATALW